MRTGSRLFRLSLWLATSSISITAVAPAMAQPAPPADAPAAAAGDPPALAGRLSALAGTVSTHAAGVTEWSAAVLNNPVTNGDSFWTEPQSSATIEVGSDHFVMAEATELDVAQLDQSQFAATEAQGEIYLGLRDLPDGQSLTINTPRGAVQITATGQYDIVAGDSATPTTVTVITGSAMVTGAGVNLTVSARQTATITGDTQFAGNLGAAQQGAFLQAQLAADVPAPPQASAPRQLRYMTGGGDLGRYGAWQSTSEYGQVWYPNNVASDWAPYREGHWAYVGPWGWTWVDDEPWGFAPFHYGRWVSYGGRWGWVAAAPDAPYDDYPVYAPALVGFVGIGAGLLIGGAFGGGFRDGGIGWVPLGFREPYRPWYHTSDRYFQRVNRLSVVHVTNLTIRNEREITVNRFANARGATVVSAGAMVRGERLRGVARPLPETALEKGRPFVGRLPVSPSAQTPGLSRGEARRFNVALPVHPVHPVAPGPLVRPGGAPARPALRTAPGSAPPAASRPIAPGPAIGRPGAGRPVGLPPLRAAGGSHNRPAPVTPPGIRPAATPGQRPGGPIPRPAENRPHASIAHPSAPQSPRPPAAPHLAAPRQVNRAPRPAQPHIVRPPVERAPERRPEPRPEFHAPPRAPEFHPAPRPAPRPAPQGRPAAPEGHKPK